MLGDLIAKHLRILAMLCSNAGQEEIRSQRIAEGKIVRHQFGTLAQWQEMRFA